LSDDDIAAIQAVSDQRALTELVTSLGQARSASIARDALDDALAR
jgi:cell division protein FtsX